MKKDVLRKKYLDIRRNIDKLDKIKYDNEIFEKIINLKEYVDSKKVLTYVSLMDEVDTLKIIDHSLSIGKKVGVPKCIGKEMKFYYINSIHELKKEYFDILEPVNISDNRLVADFKDSICIVPGICFDLDGNRLGYGGGYYDRFLSTYEGIKIGITYKECICNEIDVDKYDIKVDRVICND